MSQANSTQRFADRLAQERRHKSVVEQRDVLKKDIAKTLGVSASTVGRWEDGLAMPSDEMMLELARYFGVTAAWLRYGAEPREAPPEQGGTLTGLPRRPRKPVRGAADIRRKGKGA